MRSRSRYWRWRYNKITSRARNVFYRRLYRDHFPDVARTVLVAGTARSGTTWLGDLIASQGPTRILFEPFNPELIEAYQQFNYFQYMRPEEENEPLADYCSRLFSGRIRHHWIDREITHLSPRYRVVKAVRANLMLGWIARQFPDVPQVLIIRHPCAVVLSRMKLGWATDADIEPLLAQPKLVDDFLANNIELIQECRTDEEKHAIIWSVSYLVPLKQIASSNTRVIFYENLHTRPKAEVPRLLEAIGRVYDDRIHSHLDSPSATSRGNSAVVSGNNIIEQWQHELLPSQIDRILGVVDAFGLGYLYGNSLLPEAMLYDIVS